MTCYHEKWKQKNKYGFLNNMCNKNMYAFFMLNTQDEFEQTERSFAEELERSTEHNWDSYLEE